MRWLHGRTGFEGERLIYRLIGDPLESLVGTSLWTPSAEAVPND
jgi:hypothetical protein